MSIIARAMGADADELKAILQGVSDSEYADLDGASTLLKVVELFK